MFKYFLGFIAIISTIIKVSGQEIAGFNHTFNNMYLINPASAGALGHGVGYLTYHKNWLGIEGAPETSSLSFNTPASDKVGLGFNLFNDKRSLLNSSGALLTFAYSLNFSDVSHLRFGISGGASFNSFDLNAAVLAEPDDIALFNKLNNSISPDGNFGIQLNLDRFHAGFAMPKLFSAPIVSSSKLAKAEFQQFDNLLFNLGYKINFIPKILEFHPMVIYRMYKNNNSQFEANGIFTFNETLWVGGNYKQNSGFAAMAGVKVKRISIGYAYEIPSNEIKGYASASHEIQLAFHFGRKKDENKKPPVYSTPTKKPVVIKPATTSKPIVKKPTTTTVYKPKPVVTSDKPVATVTKPAATTPKKDEQVKKDTVQKKTYTPPVVKKPQYTVVNKKPVVKTEQPVVNTKPKTESPKLPTDKKNPVYIPKSEIKSAAIKITKDTVARTITYETETKTITVPEGERIVVARRGTHPLELGPGNYIIVGAFSVFENAKKFKGKLMDTGYPAQLGYNSDKGLFYVYIHSYEDLNEAIDYKNELRKKDGFESSWVFIIE